MTVLVTREAPDFTAPAVLPNGVIEENYKLSDLRGKYVVLFFYPLDFTFVCPTEIIAHHLDTLRLELGHALVMGNNFGGTHKGEIQRIEENHDVFAAQLRKFEILLDGTAG